MLEQLFQGHIFKKAHVADGEVCIIARIVGKGRLSSIKNIVPSCSETTLEIVV
jgi:hypothetical protein